MKDVFEYLPSEKPPRRSLVLQLSLLLLVAVVGALLLVVIQRAWLDVTAATGSGELV